MQLIAAAPARAEVEAWIAAARGAAAADRGAAARLARLHELWQQTPAAWNLVKRLLAEVAESEACAGSRPAPERWSQLFDRAAAVSPDAAAALYLLGRDDLAALATRSIVEHLQRWSLLPPHASVLDLGCGAGRLVAATAPLVRRVVGIDVSPAMLAVARRRCASLANVELRLTGGRTLSGFPDGSFDLVVACDVLPYLVACGGGLVSVHFREASRVLVAGGTLLVINYSYRGDADRDAADVALNARLAGFTPSRVADADLALWDGRVFILSRSGSRCAEPS